MLDDVLLPNGCDFVSINENFDTSSPYGRAMIGILSVFAQLERETIRERTVMGRIERAKEGWYSGNTRIPIGYDYIDGKLVVNEYEAMQIKEMFELYISGISTNAIYKLFIEKGYSTKHGIWSSPAVIRTLIGSKLYHGELKYKGEYYKGKHTPIIDKATWEKAQQINKLMHKNTSGDRKNPFSATHLLTGLIYCANCGGRMHAKTRGKSYYPEYMCYSFSKQSEKYITDRNCKPHIWQCWELDEMVLESIKELSLKTIKEVISKDSNNSNNEIIHKRIKEIERSLSRLMDLYLMDGMSKQAVESKSKELTEEKIRLESQVSNEKPKLKAKDIYKLVKEIEFIMQNGTMEEKRSSLLLIIDKILVYNDDIEIFWSF